MSITVEQFVEVCSSNSASDAACGIYTYPLNVEAWACQEHLYLHTAAPESAHRAAKKASVSHCSSPARPFSAVIKTQELLAPSRTNLTALCSLVLEPNGLIWLSSRPPFLLFSLSPCVNASICETFVMNGWGKRGDREMWATAPLGSAKAKKKENEQGTCVRGCECVCARMWVLGECRSVALELHTKAPTCTLPCIYVLTVRDAECAWTCVCVCVCGTSSPTCERVHVSARPR